MRLAELDPCVQLPELLQWLHYVTCHFDLVYESCACAPRHSADSDLGHEARPAAGCWQHPPRVHTRTCPHGPRANEVATLAAAAAPLDSSNTLPAQPRTSGVTPGVAASLSPQKPAEQSQQLCCFK